MVTGINKIGRGVVAHVLLQVGKAQDVIASNTNDMENMKEYSITKYED